jgi:hypothetical protein
MESILAIIIIFSIGLAIGGLHAIQTRKLKLWMPPTPSARLRGKRAMMVGLFLMINGLIVCLLSLSLFIPGLQIFIRQLFSNLPISFALLIVGLITSVGTVYLINK